MRILVIGAGAIGGYVGGLLSLGGHEVSFGVRPLTASTLRTAGLRLQGPRGDWHLTKFDVLDDPELEVPGFDVAISCVKLYDVESSSRQWARQLARSSAIISLQNGVDGQDGVARGSGVKAVYGGLAYVAAKLEAPGLIRYQSDMSSIVYGGPGALNDEVLGHFDEAVKKVGQLTPFQSTRLEDIASAQWQKFCALATNAALTCLVRKPAGVVYRDEDILALAEQSIAEILEVGSACGAVFPPDHGAKTLAMLKGLPPAMVASMHHDLADGRRLELDGLSGTVNRLARAHGISTPFHSMAYACLKPYKNGVTTNERPTA